MTAPLRAAVSKPAQRVYLNTIVLMIVSSFLLVAAVASYIVFYMHYIPSIGVSRRAYLQFDESPSSSYSIRSLYHDGSLRGRSEAPHAIMSLSPDVIAGQPYDVSVQLRLPSSPANIAHANFMLDLRIYDATSSSSSSSSKKQTQPLTPLLHARRPAIVTYASPLLHTLRTLFAAPLLLPGLWRQEETLVVQLAAGARFTAAPATARLQIDHGIAVYDAVVRFDARFEGLRWFMYHWRVSAFFVFTSIFWGTEMLWAAALWWYVSARLEAAAAEREYQRRRSRRQQRGRQQARRRRGRLQDFDSEEDDDDSVVSEDGEEGEDLDEEDEEEEEEDTEEDERRRGGGAGVDRDVQRTFPVFSRQRPIAMPEHPSSSYPSPRPTPDPDAPPDDAADLDPEALTPESTVAGGSEMYADDEGDDVVEAEMVNVDRNVDVDVLPGDSGIGTMSESTGSRRRGDSALATVQRRRSRGRGA